LLFIDLDLTPKSERDQIKSEIKTKIFHAIGSIFQMQSRTLSCLKQYSEHRSILLHRSTDFKKKLLFKISMRLIGMTKEFCFFQKSKKCNDVDFFKKALFSICQCFMIEPLKVMQA